MDRPREHHTEGSKSDRERQTSYDVTYRRNRKMILQMNLLTKQKQMHRLREELRVTFGEAYG